MANNINNADLEVITSKVSFDNPRLYEDRMEYISTTTQYSKQVPKGTPQYRISWTESDIIGRESALVTTPLHVTDAKVIADRRKYQYPTFIYKNGGRLWYASIPKDLNLMGPHFHGRNICGIAYHECARLSPALDYLGGCAKIRNGSTGIEIYPWIKRGFETFGVNTPVMTVLECEHYESVKSSK